MIRGKGDSLYGHVRKGEESEGQERRKIKCTKLRGRKPDRLRGFSFRGQTRSYEGRLAEGEGDRFGKNENMTKLQQKQSLAG